MSLSNNTSIPLPGVSDNARWISTGTRMGLITAIVGAISIWLVRFVQYRRVSKNLAPNIPRPPFNFLLGNLKAMASIYANCPTDSHPQAAMTLMHRKWNLGNLWVLDNWPANPCRQMIVVEPDILAGVFQSLPKHPTMWDYVGHICGDTSILFGDNDETWKQRRALFNPGFSFAHIMTQVPSIVEDTSVFFDVLGEIADFKKIVPLEEYAARVTIDIMGHIVLDHDLNSQRTKNPFVEAFRGSISWTPSVIATNPLVQLNLFRPFMQRLYAKRMDSYLEKVLDDRYANRGDVPKIRKGRKPAIDLALDEYALQKGFGVSGSARKIDKAFKRVALDQMRTFLFAGHDTSSSTICYIYHLLNTHPEALAKTRQEHDLVFGSGTNGKDVGRQLQDDASLVNQLPYTLAVIKETLRLFPPGTPVREGKKGVSITYNGVDYPTENFMVFLPTHTIHRRADLFPCPDEFIPERFITGPESYQEIPKDAWRAFEKGPRACIGQELALLEMKIILAMTLRDFDIKAEYEEWDRMHGRDKPGDVLEGRRGVLGERAYQVLVASAKPADGMPVRIQRRMPSP
ncbi:P450 monooxygenase [Phlyctema vagabunda]|uniref:P450 monooxygenase n=1 Tax=Phlyctema vagabunda TaxID=108571 RepID=A0ABR4P943_9HELO